MAERDYWESELQAALNGLESNFVYRGQCYFSDKVTVKAGDVEVSFPISNDSAKTQLPKLKDAAKESAFGKGKQTVVDPNVRLAKELEAGKVDIDWEPSASLLDEVRQRLVPDAESIRADFYKLNLYTKGGHFKRHKDTPRGDTDTCFGTLVVALPVQFEGGKLICQHQGKEEHCDFSKGFSPSAFGHSICTGLWPSSKGPTRENTKVYANGRSTPIDQWEPPSVVSWAAFFGDVDHEVMSIEFGWRVTLTYVLHRTPSTEEQEEREKEPATGSDQLLVRASNFHTTLTSALEDPDFMPDGGTIVCYTRHQYEETQLAASEAKLKKGGQHAYASKLKLKNEDASAAAAFRASGLEVECLRLLSEDTGLLEEKQVMKKMPKQSEAKKFAPIGYVEDDFKAPCTDDDQIIKFSEGSFDEKYPDALILGEPAKKGFVSAFYSATGYFGNEASETTFYTEAALVAKVPEFADGQRAQLDPSAVKELTKDHIWGDVLAKNNKKKNNKNKKKRGTSNGEASVEEEEEASEGEGEGEGKKKSKTSYYSYENLPATSKAAAATQVPTGIRRIQVVGGQGSNAGKHSQHGCMEVVLEGTQGVRELKAQIRKGFGKYARHKLGKLLLENGKDCTKADLTNGQTVRCTYVYANSDPTALINSTRRKYGPIPWFLMPKVMPRDDSYWSD